ncbi:lysozyme-like protein 5 [Ditylenchus destructor]|nr:lysozyme-like protein 5 [Ditylenchus destructor]
MRMIAILAIAILAVTCINACQTGFDSDQLPQAADAINNLLKTNGANIGRVWLQVLAGQWPNNPTSNQNFINQFAAQVRAQQPQFGILSDAESWENVTGPGYSGDSQYQLWWAEHNGIADYIGWVTFGGWSLPSMHQYNSNVQLNSACSTTANQDWFF